MFGNKKREQRKQEAEEAALKAEEARKRAEEAEREAREAEAAADALKADAPKKKASFFSRFRKRAAEDLQAEEPAAPEAKSAPSMPEEAPQPAEAETSAQEAESIPVEKISRKERKRMEREDRKKDDRIKELEDQLRRAEKKSKSARFCDFFAFIVLLAAALLMLLGPVLKLILEKTGAASAEALATVSIVAQYCLLAAIALPAWYFVYRKSLGWKIVFFLALVGFIVGNILGLTL